MKTKAAVLYKINKPLVIKEIETPDLQAGQVLVEILYTGICRTQLNEILGLKGEDSWLPHLLGHEGSGIVKEIGPGVEKVKKGDYVVLSWIKGQGKDVSSCQYKDENNNIINSGAITTFSEYSVISENRLFKIPEKIPPKIASLLGCALLTGGGMVKNEIKLEKENSIIIFGTGGIGSSALLYAKAIGCSNIIAVDINDSKLEFAKTIGATHTINPLKQDTTTNINNITNNKGVDFALESSGTKKAMEQAFKCIKDSGTAIIAGNLKKGEEISINPFDLIKGKKIIGTWGGGTNPDKDIPYYADLYLQGKINLEKLITKTYSLDEINNAIEDLKQGKVIRALIKLKNI